MNLGIDFGTSYTKLAYWENGQLIDVLEDHRIPSIATYIPAFDKLFFDSAAIHLADADSISALFFKLNLKRNPEFSLGKFTLADILFNFFSYLRYEYLNPLKIRPDSISLSVPNNFGLRARRALLKAAQNAFALENIVLIPEPLAALIGYNTVHPGAVRGDLLCVDIGGGTTDFSFLSVIPEQGNMLLESQLQIGQDVFSGSEIDKIILRQLFAPAYQMQYSESLPAGILQEDFRTARDSFYFQKWIRYAEELKIAMSSQDAFVINIPDFYLDHPVNFECTREKFLQAVKPVNKRLLSYWEEAIVPRARSLGLLSGSTWHLDALLLLGGASQTRGLYDLIASLTPGIPVLISSTPDFNVIRGLARWSDSHLNPKLKLKTVYPFRFYLEKKACDENTLEEITFDTANLELDFQGNYEICSILTDSDFNLAQDEQKFHLKVYEVAEEDQNAGLDKFMDQDLVLELSALKSQLKNPLALYLNLGKSRLELDNNNLLSGEYEREDDILSSIKMKQRAAYNFLSAYKYMDEWPLSVSEKENDGSLEESPLQDSSQAALSKILSILDIYNDK